MPSGGAEIFDEEVSRKSASTRPDSQHWIDIHREAHNLDCACATMLYGHVEQARGTASIHLCRLRELQDETGGFRRSFAGVSSGKYGARPHSKAKRPDGPEDDRDLAADARQLRYIEAWIMLGKRHTDRLSFGADDLDGTVVLS